MNIRVIIAFISLVWILALTGCVNSELSPATSSATTSSEAKYMTFELKADDIRLKEFSHPLYRFEYPSKFRLYDENLADIPHISYDETEVLFTLVLENLPEPLLIVTVERPDNHLYSNAVEKYSYLLSKYSPVDYLQTSTKQICGIEANCISVRFQLGESKPYPQHLVSNRHCLFEYEGLIWEILLNWDFTDTEPVEVQEYFDHVIDSFRILD